MGPSVRDLLIATPLVDVVDRVDLNALLDYLQTTARFAEVSLQGSLQAIQLGVALIPNSIPVLDIQGCAPAEVEEMLRVMLTKSLRGVPAPTATGAVLFAHRIAATGGDLDRLFLPPFYAFVTSRSPHTLEAILLEAAGSDVWPTGNSWWRSFRSRQRANVIGDISRHLRCTVRAAEKIGRAAAAPAPEFEGSPGDPLVAMRMKNGSTQVIDRILARYYLSESPQPTQSSLDRLFGLAERIRVYDKPLEHDRTCIAELVSRQDIDALRQTMAICDGPGGHCMCIGGATIELLDGREQTLTVFSVHHGRAIRSSRWKDDAIPLDGVALLRWLDERGEHGPLESFFSEQDQQRDADARWQAWFARMPTCLSTLSADEWHQGSNFVRARLDAAYEHPSRAVLDLLEWTGSGSTPWKTFPLHELTPYRLLATYPRDLIVASADEAQLTDRQIEGCARFLSQQISSFESWALNPWRQEYVVSFPPPTERSDVPARLASRILLHFMESRDEDVRQCAAIAFGGDVPGHA